MPLIRLLPVANPNLRRRVNYIGTSNAINSSYERCRCVHDNCMLAEQQSGTNMSAGTRQCNKSRQKPEVGSEKWSKSNHRHPRNEPKQNRGHGEQYDTTGSYTHAHADNIWCTDPKVSVEWHPKQGRNTAKQSACSLSHQDQHERKTVNLKQPYEYIYQMHSHGQ